MKNYKIDGKRFLDNSCYKNKANSYKKIGLLCVFFVCVHTLLLASTPIQLFKIVFSIVLYYLIFVVLLKRSIYIVNSEIWLILFLLQSVFLLAYNSNSYVVSMTVTIILNCAVYFIIRLTFNNYSEQLLIRIIYYICVIYALITVYEMLFQDSFFKIAEVVLVPHQYKTLYYLDAVGNRLSGLGIYNTNNSFILAVGFIIYINMYTRTNMIHKIFALMMLVGIIRSGGKTALFGFVLTLFLYIFLTRILQSSREKKVLYVFTLFLVSILLFIIVANMFEYIEHTNFTNKILIRYFASDILERSINSRIHIYESAWKLFFLNPIFGSGLGSFQFYSLNITGRAQNVHNLLVQLLCEMGIVGTIFFILYAGHVFRQLINKYNKVQCMSGKRVIKIGLLINILFLFNSIASNALYLSSVSLIWMIINAILINIIIRFNKESRFKKVKTYV